MRHDVVRLIGYTDDPLLRETKISDGPHRRMTEPRKIDGCWWNPRGRERRQRKRRYWPTINPDVYAKLSPCCILGNASVIAVHQPEPGRNTPGIFHEPWKSWRTYSRIPISPRRDCFSFVALTCFARNKTASAEKFWRWKLLESSVIRNRGKVSTKLDILLARVKSTSAVIYSARKSVNHNVISF